MTENHQLCAGFFTYFLSFLINYIDIWQYNLNHLKITPTPRPLSKKQKKKKKICTVIDDKIN